MENLTWVEETAWRMAKMAWEDGYEMAYKSFGSYLLNKDRLAHMKQCDWENWIDLNHPRAREDLREIGLYR